MSSTPVQLRVEDKVIEHLKELARVRSFKSHKDISWRDLIREAINIVHPIGVKDCDIYIDKHDNKE